MAEQNQWIINISNIQFITGGEQPTINLHFSGSVSEGQIRLNGHVSSTQMEFFGHSQSTESLNDLVREKIKAKLQLSEEPAEE